MIGYAIILLIIAIIFAVVAVLICKGRTNLIHDYHQTEVTDKAAYGKAFGKTMGGIAVVMALSGAISLFGESAMWGAVAILVVGLAAGIIAILRIQKKYNGGVF